MSESTVGRSWRVGVPWGLLGVLLCASCRDERVEPLPASSSAGEAGSSLGGTAGVTTGTSGRAGEGGVVGGSAGDLGGSGSGGSSSTSTTVGTTGDVVPPVDTCEYPESLGGAGDPNRCGVTPGAWYPLGDSDLTTWPERASWGSASAGGFAVGLPPLTIAIDSDGGVFLAWTDLPHETENSEYDHVYVVGRYDDGWHPLPMAAVNERWSDMSVFSDGPNAINMVLDQSGNPVIVAGGPDSSTVWRWQDGKWVREGSVTEWARVAVDAEDRLILLVIDSPFESDEVNVDVERWNGSDREQWSWPHQANTALAFAVRENGNVVVGSSGGDPDDGEDEWFNEGVWLEELDGESWNPVGDPESVFGSGPLDSLTLATPDADQVVAAWEDSGEAWVTVFDGSEWLPAEPGLWEPELVQSPEGRVYLSGRVEPSADSRMAIWQWDAGEWVALAAPDVSFRFDLAAGPDERLAAAWLDDTTQPASVNLMVNTDGEWRELGETARGDGLDAGPARELVSLEAGLFLHGSCRVSRWNGEDWETWDVNDWVDLEDCVDSTLIETPSGQPVLAFWSTDSTDEFPDCSENDGCHLDHDLYLLGWNGDGWEILTEPFPQAFTPSENALDVAFDTEGSPFVAYTGVTYDANISQNTTDTEVMTWDGAAWQRLEALSDPPQPHWGSDPVRLLALPDGRMHATWKNGKSLYSAVHAAGEWEYVTWDHRFDSNVWIKFGFDTMGRPHAARTTAHTDRRMDVLELYRLTETAWKRVQPDDVRARLAMLPEEMRLDAFSEDGEVYLKRYEGGDEWEGVWSGLSASDRGRGVSNSQGSSTEPAVAVHEGRTCVAWMEAGEHGPAQLVRCHDL